MNASTGKEIDYLGMDFDFHPEDGTVKVSMVKMVVEIVSDWELDKLTTCKCNKFHLKTSCDRILRLPQIFAPGSNRGLKLLIVKFCSGIITILDLHSELIQDKEPLAGTLK